MISAILPLKVGKGASSAAGHLALFPATTSGTVKRERATQLAPRCGKGEQTTSASTKRGTASIDPCKEGRSAR